MAPMAIGAGSSPPDSYRERSGKERLRMQPFLILPSYSSNARERRGGTKCRSGLFENPTQTLQKSAINYTI